MKNFFRFYLIFSLIVVSFSCSEDDSDDSQNSDPINVQFIRFGDNLVPSSVVPRTTYWDTNSNRQVTSYFDTDISGNISQLSKLVGDDGSGLSTVISFDQNGIINSLYQQNPISGEITNRVYVLEDSQTGNVYFGNDEGVQEISNGALLNDFGGFLNSEDDVLVSNTLNTSKNIIDKLVFYANDTNTNRSSLNLGVLVIGAVALYAILMLAGSAVIVENVGESITCDYDNSCDDEGQRTTNDISNSCPLPHSEFVCSEVVDVTENPCEDSNLSVVIGVDPGNVLVAIVNGDSATYDFNWSTGQTDNNPISDTITVSEDGTYYVVVQDDNGCAAFASATISNDIEIDPSLIIGSWLLTGGTEGVGECNEVMIFNQTQLTSTQFYGANCSLADTVVSQYSIENGNFLYDTFEGDTDISEILELTDTSLVLRYDDSGFIFIENYTRQ